MLHQDKPAIEMSLFQTLSYAARLYQRGFRFFFTSTLLLSVIMFGLIAIFLMFQVNVVQGNPTFYDSAMGMISQFFAMSLYILILSLLYLVGASIVTGYNLSIGEEIIAGNLPDQPVHRLSLKGVTGTFLLFLTVYVCVIVGSIILWVPGVLAAILLPLSIPSHLIEKTDVTGSLVQGYKLVKDRWLKTLLLFTLAGLVASVIFIVLWVSLATLSFVLIGVQGYVVTMFILMMNGAVAYALIEPYLYLTLLSHYYSMYARIGPTADR
jgi:hypothetical protein